MGKPKKIALSLTRENGSEDEELDYYLFTKLNADGIGSASS